MVSLESVTVFFCHSFIFCKFIERIQQLNTLYLGIYSISVYKLDVVIDKHVSDDEFIIET